MNKDTKMHALIAILLITFGACAGYRAKEYYGSLAQKWRTQVIQEAIADGEVIRTSTIRLKGLPKEYARK